MVCLLVGVTVAAQIWQDLDADVMRSWANKDDLGIAKWLVNIKEGMINTCKFYDSKTECILLKIMFSMSMYLFPQCWSHVKHKQICRCMPLRLSLDSYVYKKWINVSRLRRAVDVKWRKNTKNVCWRLVAVASLHHYNTNHFSAITQSKIVNCQIHYFTITAIFK